MPFSALPVLCVHALAAYGGDMLSGELVSWPGLPIPGQMAAHWALNSYRAARDFPPADAVLPWLFLLYCRFMSHANTLARADRLI